MNIHQASYLLGRAVGEFGDFFVTYPMTAAMTYWVSQWDLQAINNPELVNKGWLGVANFVAFGFLTSCGMRIAIRQDLWNERKKCSEEHPLECVDKIIIHDTAGLETLLAETHKGSFQEWGTAFRVGEHEKTAVVSEILTPAASKEKGFIVKAGSFFVFYNVSKMLNEGYSGRQHYHPNYVPQIFRSSNFAISPIDRYGPLNLLNLLTFNTPSGPELIGYNKRFVYLPADSSKKELVKASPRDVWNYLGRK